MQQRIAFVFAVIMAIVALMIAAFLFSAGVMPKPSYSQPPKPAVVYVDQAEIPHFSSTAEMGEKYPHIVIEGEKLDYDPADAWYKYAGMPTQRALWLEFVKGDGTVHRDLAVPVQHFVDGKDGTGWYRLTDGRWAFERAGEAPGPNSPPPPPPDDEEPVSDEPAAKKTALINGAPPKWYETEENKVAHEEGWEDYIKPIGEIGPDGKYKPKPLHEAREHIVERPKQ